MLLETSNLTRLPPEHVLRLYEGTDALAAEVSELVLLGVRERAAVVLIASEDHVEAFREAMRDRGLAIELLEETGQVQWFDADELLGKFFVDRAIDRARFSVVLGEVVSSASARFGRVRAFGEMVNLLWARGERAAALELERCWDGLIASTSVGLLCAYDLRGFSSQDDHEAFGHVCAAHTRVVPTERQFGPATSAADRDGLIAQLQQRTLALETEVVRSRALAEERERLLESERAQREQLADLLQERARLLDEARLAVHQRDEFLSIASHELKTPLASLQLLVQGLLRNPAQAREPVEKALAKASTRLNRLGALVDELLDASQLSTEPFALERAEVSLGTLARTVVEAFSEQAQRSGTTIRFALHSDAVGSWDRRRLEQVLGHLLTNAIKHAGGATVDVEVERSEDAARLRVRDTGRGIAEQDQQRIFHRFERSAPARRGGGLGLGLWLSRAIVEAHGGTLTVESAPGAGATFLVSLPLQAAR